MQIASISFGGHPCIVERVIWLQILVEILSVRPFKLDALDSSPVPFNQLTSSVNVFTSFKYDLGSKDILSGSRPDDNLKKLEKHLLMH